MKIDIPKAITAQIGILTSNIVEKKNLDTKNIAKFKSLNKKKKKKKSSDSRQRSEYPPPPPPEFGSGFSVVVFCIVNCSLQWRQTINKFTWMEGLVMGFYVPFNSISVISGRWKGEHERLCAMKHLLGSGRIWTPAGFESATPWSDVGSANRSATRTQINIHCIGKFSNWEKLEISKVKFSEKCNK